MASVVNSRLPAARAACLRRWRTVASAVLAAVIIATSSAVAGEPVAPEAKPTPCTLQAGPLRTVTAVIDGETVRFDDGTQARLIGALAPRASDADAKAGSWPEEEAATSALRDLVLAKRVRLAYGGRRSDRYGRLLVHLYVLDRQGGEEWVQGAMLLGGHARTYGLEGSFACAYELMAHEAEARRLRAGLWRNGVYRSKPASRPGYLMTLRGRYERVIGKIQGVATTKSAIYLNFGNDWRTDFTARVEKSAPAFAALAPNAKAFEGRRVVVRGWIERRNGPMIDVVDVSQIEAADGEGTHPATPSGGTGAETAGAPSGEGEAKRPAPAMKREPGGVDL